MKTAKFLLLIIVGSAIGLVAEVKTDWSGPFGVSISLTADDAEASPARRTARRTSRRTTARLSTLPGGCAYRAPYYYCGGVYYQPVVGSGTTVYIVVYP